MDEDRVAVAGSESDLTALEMLAHKDGLKTERGAIIANAVGAPSSEVLWLLGVSSVVISRCMNVFLKKREKRVAIFRADDERHCQKLYELKRLDE